MSYNSSPSLPAIALTVSMSVLLAVAGLSTYFLTLRSSPERGPVPIGYSSDSVERVDETSPENRIFGTVEATIRGHEPLENEPSLSPKTSKTDVNEDFDPAIGNTIVEQETKTTELPSIANASKASQAPSGQPGIIATNALTLSGSATGVFENPQRLAASVVTLQNRTETATMTFGRASELGQPANEITFTGFAFEPVRISQRFPIGSLSYYNGTVHQQTDVASVDIDLGLQLASASNTDTESSVFTLDFISQPNLGKQLNEDADLVRIRELSAPVTLPGGAVLELHLEFGDVTTNGFSTGDTFGIHENTTATTVLYGVFRQPVISKF